MGQITGMDYRNGPKHVSLGIFMCLIRTYKLRVASESGTPKKYAV